MHYLVDGYNVINSSDIFISNTLEDRRRKLIKFIKDFKPHGSQKNSISIIFDFKSKNSNPNETSGYSKTYIEGIEIIFSDGMSSADDIIVEIVETSESPYNITVVTDDRGIRRRISAFCAKYESVEMFLSKRFKRKDAEFMQKFNNDIKDKINKELENLWLKK
ncbi:MAG: NYN domain-containing protein [Endomicrobium sp.]|jgi:predicted RNA-binding protein with PIN domain|nr:NYN domain-containing protein [Endomicrobium sp.]